MKCYFEIKTCIMCFVILSMANATNPATNLTPLQATNPTPSVATSTASTQAEKTDFAHKDFANIIKNNNLFQVQSSHFIHDLRYASERNFIGIKLYKNLNKCLLHKDLQSRIENLDRILKAKRLKIVFFDCFRPHSAQKIAWEKIGDERFVANPYKNGSHHSRAIALDVGLADENGEILEMPSEFDEFSQKAFSVYKCPKAEDKKCANREVLKAIMKEAGFVGIKSEWWHYEADFLQDFPPLDKSQIREKYPLLDLP